MSLLSQISTTFTHGRTAVKGTMLESENLEHNLPLDNRRPRRTEDILIN